MDKSGGTIATRKVIITIITPARDQSVTVSPGPAKTGIFLQPEHLVEILAQLVRICTKNYRIHEQPHSKNQHFHSMI